MTLLTWCYGAIKKSGEYTVSYTMEYTVTYSVAGSVELPNRIVVSLPPKPHTIKLIGCDLHLEKHLRL